VEVTLTTVRVRKSVLDVEERKKLNRIAAGPRA
jgi:hypothetical protein